MERDEIFPTVKVAWPPRHIRILINLLVDEVTKGKMNNGQIGRHSWKRITSNLEAQANHAYSLKQVKGKFNRLRILHREFSTLLREPTGFGWDPETNTVTASEEAWQKHLDKHPNAKVFQKKGLANYNLLGLVFNKSTATGGLAHGSFQLPANTDEEDVEEELMEGGIHIDMVPGVGSEEDMECCQTNEGAHGTDSGNRSGAMGQRSGKRSRGRKKKETKASVMKETFLAMTEVCKARTKHTLAKMDTSLPSGEGSSRPSGNSNAHYPSIRECIEICKQYGTPETHGHKFLEAAQRFEHEWWREAFLALPDESRRIWLERL